MMQYRPKILPYVYVSEYIEMWNLFWCDTQMMMLASFQFDF